MGKRVSESDPAFQEYIEKYCKDRGVSVAEALRHKMVKNYWLFIKGKLNENKG